MRRDTPRILETKMHQTIKKVSNDFENLKYNTAIAAMMTLLNDFYKKGSITRGELKTLIILLNPVAPHITEEMWQIIVAREEYISRHGRSSMRQRRWNLPWRLPFRSMVR